MEQSKKILYIHHGRVIGGAPISLLNMLLGLQEITTDLELKVLFVYDDMKPFFQEHARVPVGDIADPCLTLGRLLIGWTSLFNSQARRMCFREIRRIRSSIRRQREQLQQENPALVHLNSSILFTTAIAAKQLGIPVVWHVREVLQGSRWNLRKRFAGWLIRTFADRVIAISPAEAESLGKDTYHNVETIHNFVDFSRFDASLYDQKQEKAKFGVAPDEKLIISLGGLSWRKGTLELIEAMHKVDSNVKLLIAGAAAIPGKKRLSKKKKIKLVIENALVKTGLKPFCTSEYQSRISQALTALRPDQVQFIGSLADVVPFIAACDLLAAPHTFSHSARPIFEAWAMKKPVVAFDIPGISESIDDGVDGILVKKFTGNALGEAIRTVIQHDNLLEYVGEEGYKKAYTHFRKDINIPKIRNMYAKLM